jgi:ATP-binding cassette, subfamily C, bacterial EexD
MNSMKNQMAEERPANERQSLLRDVFGAGRKEITTSAVLSMFINILALTLPLYMLHIFTHVLVSNSKATLIMVTLLAVAAISMWGILSYIRLGLLICLSEKIDLLLGERVQRAMIARAVSSNEVRTAGGLKHLATLRNSIGGQQAAALLDVPWSPLFFAVIYLLSPALGLIAMGGAALLLIVAWLNDRMIREPQSEAAKAADEEYAFSLASVRNAEVVEGMGMRPAVVSRWLQQHLRSLGFYGLMMARSSAMMNLSRTLRMLLQIIILGAGAYLVISRELGIGVMMASVYLLARGLAPIDSAISTWRQLTSATAAYRQLGQLLEAEGMRPKSIKLPRPAGRLTVHNLTFGRRGLPPVLKGISFSVEPGEVVGIVGPSAAGKSTLARLLVGVWRPTSGVVRLDGSDVTNWNPDDLGRYIGYLPQEVELFSGPVHENIARLGNVEDTEIIAAAQLAGAHELILKLPKGYETEIGEAGSVLSGGQRQRIGLARALLGSPSLIVLDEPNANLDGAGEEALVAAITRTKAQGATVVLITHKPALLFTVDKILVINDGIVDKFGERNEILPKIIPAAQKQRLVSVAESKAGTSP